MRILALIGATVRDYVFFLVAIPYLLLIWVVLIIAGLRGEVIE